MKEIIYALILTILIEGITLIILKEQRLIKYSFLINTLTNIPLNLILKLFTDNFIVYIIILIILEIIIIAIETIFYNLILKNKKYAFKISIILNISSFIIGTILLNLIRYI